MGSVLVAGDRAFDAGDAPVDEHEARLGSARRSRRTRPARPALRLCCHRAKAGKGLRYSRLPSPLTPGSEPRCAALVVASDNEPPCSPASTEAKSTSRALKFGVSAFARLLASTETRSPRSCNAFSCTPKIESSFNMSSCLSFARVTITRWPARVPARTGVATGVPAVAHECCEEPCARQRAERKIYCCSMRCAAIRVRAEKIVRPGWRAGRALMRQAAQRQWIAAERARQRQPVADGICWKGRSRTEACASSRYCVAQGVA